MMQTKEVKLTDRQQDVVNLMGQGSVLHWGSGIRFNGGYAWLSGSKSKVQSSLPRQLLDKGVVVVKSKDWRGAKYVLTDLGKSLAKKPEKAEATVWYGVPKHGTEIREKAFVRETDAYLVDADGGREAKMTEYWQWYSTREDATQVILYRLESQVDNYREAHERAVANLEAFRREIK